MLEAARAEHPRPELAEQVLSELSYRQRVLTAPEASSPRGRARSKLYVAAAGVSLTLVAAAAMLALFPHAPKLRALDAAALPSVGSTPAGAPQLAVSATPIVPSVDPCRDRVVAAGRQPLIDDFEDGDDAVSPFEGRLGLWRWVRDTDRPGTAPALLPIPLAAATARNRQALHVRGAKLSDWGASVEFTFQPACYDASAYRGLSLRAKGPGRIYLSAREVRLIPPEGGGTCQGSDCYNSHVMKFDLTSKFATYEARWVDLQQRGYGKPALDPGHLHSITVMIKPEDTPYDVWLDDLKFLD